MSGQRLAWDTMMALSMLRASFGSPAIIHSLVRRGLPKADDRLKPWLTATP